MGMRIKLLDLFSGIGGFSLAARWAGGFETVGFCEIDAYCQKVLNKNFPGVPIHDDIKTLKGNEFGPIDIITGGFPCQPFSYAGKRKGKADDRDLWPEMFRVIKHAKPRWVVGENVAGFINVGFERTATNLENEGYEVQALLIPACAVNAPHRRDRLWIVAHAEPTEWRARQSSADVTHGKNAGRSKKTSGIGASSKNGRAHAMGNANRSGSLSCSLEGIYSGEKGSRPWNEKLERRSDDVANADRNHGQWRSGALQMGRKRFQGAIAEDGLSSGAQWAIEPDVGRVANGIPRRVDRLKGLGNAIVPQVAFQILKAIQEIEKESQYFRNCRG